MSKRVWEHHQSETILADYSDPSSVMTLADLLRLAVHRLRNVRIEAPDAEAAILLAHIRGCSRSQLRLHMHEAAADDTVERFEAALRRRVQREPLAYIVAVQEFMGLKLHVDERVLIPRPETEVLVEAICGRLAGVPRPIVADIGCGSGAIGIAVARALPNATLHAVDISAAALEVALTNTTEHGLRDRVLLHQGDLLDPLRGLDIEGRMSAVVSNPPYVADNEWGALQPEITRFEPRLALSAGPDGTAFHRRIIARSRAFLSDGALLALEVGLGQAGAVAAEMAAAGYKEVETIADLSGIERVVLGRWAQ